VALHGRALPASKQIHAQLCIESLPNIANIAASPKRIGLVGRSLTANRRRCRRTVLIERLLAHCRQSGSNPGLSVLPVRGKNLGTICLVRKAFFLTKQMGSIETCRRVEFCVSLCQRPGHRGHLGLVGLCVFCKLQIPLKLIRFDSRRLHHSQRPNRHGVKRELGSELSAKSAPHRTLRILPSSLTPSPTAQRRPPDFYSGQEAPRLRLRGEELHPIFPISTMRLLFISPAFGCEITY